MKLRKAPKCHKVIYDTKEEAMFKADSAYDARGEYTAYKCRYFDHWHIGHVQFMKCKRANKKINSREHEDFYASLKKDCKVMSVGFLVRYLKNSPTYRHHVMDDSNCQLMVDLSDRIKKENLTNIDLIKEFSEN